MAIKYDDDERGSHAPDPFAAKMDIARRNAENEKLWSPSQKAKAQQLRKLAQAAHCNGGYAYPPNWRETKMAVKVRDARPVLDKLGPGWSALDVFIAANNVKCSRTRASGKPTRTVIYSLK